MSLGPIRPRFRLTLSKSVEQCITQIEQAVTDPACGCVSRRLGNHVDVTVSPEHRHRWSPCVQMEFDDSDDETVMTGLVGPHPNTWTLFAFINITLAVALTFGLILGLVQLSLQLNAWGLWVGGGCVLLLAFMYIASQAGQRFAAEQSHMLLALIEESLETTGLTATPNKDV